MRHLLLLAATVFGLVGCSGATPVTVTNHSTAVLEQVVVTGSGFREPLGTIAPGGTGTAEIRPKGESGIAISFRSGAKRVSLPPQGYFEAGGKYVVTVAVAPDLEATVETRLRNY